MWHLKKFGNFVDHKQTELRLRNYDKVIAILQSDKLLSIKNSKCCQMLNKPKSWHPFKPYRWRDENTPYL